MKIHLNHTHKNADIHLKCVHHLALVLPKSKFCDKGLHASGLSCGMTPRVQKRWTWENKIRKEKQLNQACVIWAVYACVGNWNSVLLKILWTAMSHNCLKLQQRSIYPPALVPHCSSLPRSIHPLALQISCWPCSRKPGAEGRREVMQLGWSMARPYLHTLCWSNGQRRNPDGEDVSWR